MPAADISEVKVTFGNGIKREEYGPVKRAEVTIVSIVGQGEDGISALNYVSRIAQDKVRELLTIQGQAPAAEPAVIEQQPASAAQEPATPNAPAAEAPKTRVRRTKEQIAADEATAKAALLAPKPGEEPDEPPAAGDAPDEWEAPTAPDVTDAELNHTCSVTAERVKDPIKVKAVIQLFNPGGDAFDPAKGGRRFTVNDIPQSQRSAFVEKLKSLT